MNQNEKNALYVITGISFIVSLITLLCVLALVANADALNAKIERIEQQIWEERQERQETAKRDAEKTAEPESEPEPEEAPPPAPKANCNKKTVTKSLAVTLINPQLAEYAPASELFSVCNAKDKEIALTVTPGMWSSIRVMSGDPYTVNKSQTHAPGVLETELNPTCGYCTALIFGETYATEDYIRPEWVGAFPKNPYGTYTIRITPTTNAQLFQFSGSPIVER